MNVAVLLGGSSPERFVSFESGIAIGQALKSLGHKVIFIDPASKNERLSEENLNDYRSLIYSKETETDSVQYLFSHLTHLKNKIKPDILFLALHGGEGENGLVQDLCDRIGLKYTGSNGLSSKLAMNKSVAKTLLNDQNVPVLKSYVFSSNDNFTEINAIEFPVVVKPNSGGSSVALHIISEKNNLENAVIDVLKYDTEALVEPYFKGREVTVTILNGKAYPIIEITPSHDTYDYECKYTEGMSVYTVPAKISEKLTKSISEAALTAYNTLQLGVYGRIDFLLNEEGKYICLEANTLPGMTSTSLVPKSVGSVGITFEKLVESILIHSLEK